MKKTTKLLTVTLSVVFCVSVGKMIIDNKEQLFVQAESETYEVRLDSTNRYTSLPATSATYVPSRAIPWYFDGPCSAPEDGHIKYTYTTASGWNNFWNKNIGDYPTYGIKGIQSLSIEYAFTGTISNAKMYYHGTEAPAAGTADADVIDFNESGLSNPVILDSDDLLSYQDNFYLRFRIQTNYAGSFTIKSLVITYTCEAVA